MSVKERQNPLSAKCSSADNARSTTGGAPMIAQITVCFHPVPAVCYYLTQRVQFALPRFCDDMTCALAGHRLEYKTVTIYFSKCRRCKRRQESYNTPTPSVCQDCGGRLFVPCGMRDAAVCFQWSIVTEF